MRCLRHSWFPAYLTKVAAGPASGRRRPTPFCLGGYGFEYTIDDATLAPTELVYTVEVANTGAPVTSPFNVEFFRNAASAPVNQLGDVSQEIPALDTGASAEVSFQIADADPGTPTSWAVADANDLIDETDESDNVIARSQNDGLAAETLNGTVTATGRNSVRVYGFGTARSAQPYRLVITVP